MSMTVEQRLETVEKDLAALKCEVSSLKPNGNLTRRILQYPQASLFVTIVSFHEEVLGWNAYLSRARDASGVVRGYRRLEGILSDFARSQVLSYTSAAADNDPACLLLPSKQARRSRRKRSDDGP